MVNRKNERGHLRERIITKPRHKGKEENQQQQRGEKRGVSEVGSVASLKDPRKKTQLAQTKKGHLRIFKKDGKKKC